jgi:hypothetical protein
MNIWLRLYRLVPYRASRAAFLQRALRAQMRVLESSYGKAVKYGVRSDTLDVHKLLIQSRMTSSAIELLNLALSVAPQAKNLQEAKRKMIRQHIESEMNADGMDAEDEEFAWNSLYLSSLLQEGSPNR